MKSDATQLAPYFDYLDQIANLELKNRPSQQGGTAIRYHIARQRQGNRPLSEKVAETLLPRLNGGTVILTTGTGNPLWLPDGETDGPSGVAVLTRVFGSLGIRSCVLAEARFLPGVRAAVRAAGTPLLDEHSWPYRSNGALCLPFPTGAEAAPGFIDALLSSRQDWTAAFFIEKPGPGIDKQFHNGSGERKDAGWLAHAHSLASAARKQGMPTVGIGDGGNEIGFGVIREALFREAPHRFGCQCGCATGMLDSTLVDVLLPASVSNWGAYAVAAALALRLWQRELMPGWSEVADSIRAPIEHGAFDGYTGLALPSVDGISLRGNRAVYHLLEEVLDLAMTTRIGKPAAMIQPGR